MVRSAITELRSFRQMLHAIALLVLVIVVGSSTAAGQSLGSSIPALKSSSRELHPTVDLIGKKAPAPQFVHWYNSRPLNAADLRGHVVLLDFWATWCQPCIKNIPSVARLEEAFRGKGLIVVLAHTRNGSRMVTRRVYGQEFRTSEDVPAEDVLPRFISERQIALPVAVCEDPMFDAFGAPAVPFYVVIDQNGIVRYQGLHPPDEILIGRLLRR